MRGIIQTAGRQLTLQKSAAGLLLVFMLNACQPGIVSIAQAPNTPASVEPTKTTQPTDTRTPEHQAAPTSQPTPTSPTNPADEGPGESPNLPAVEPSPTANLFQELALPAEAWKDWPVIPLVPRNAAEIYHKGLTLGNDPHAFSILGDCQSLPETFLGIYDSDASLVTSLPADLQAAVANFSGSFIRESPTVKGGTTAGAILWSDWHENQYTCQSSESPLDCELRLHKPSFVLINLGTHYETRNTTYLHKILDELIAKGVVPILSTKADNREMDDRLNLEMAQLAVEYDLPLWNFWAAVSDLPNNGVGVKTGEEHLGEIYLSEEGLERHRLTALQTLAKVWMAVR